MVLPGELNDEELSIGYATFYILMQRCGIEGLFSFDRGLGDLPGITRIG